MKRNYILLKFLARYWAWLEEGAPHCEPFSRREGLCANMREIRDEYTYRDNAEASKTLAIMLNGEDYPFNGSLLGYHQESQVHAMHRNPKRIAFVRKAIGK